MLGCTLYKDYLVLTNTISMTSSFFIDIGLLVCNSVDIIVTNTVICD